MNSIVLLSDIHGNLTALRAVLEDIWQKYPIDGVALLGDMVNYGMRSNEVISELQQMTVPVICNIAGNHEKAILDGNLEKFSSERGREALKYTAKELNENSLQYIKSQINPAASEILTIGGKTILFIHGDLDDPYWGKLTIEKMRDERFAKYDYVISGHTHISHMVEIFFPVEDKQMRNKKKVVFLNPGSVGQPRNHNPYAQYMYIDFDTHSIHHNSVKYDIEAEQNLYSEGGIDTFYKDRLSLGI